MPINDENKTKEILDSTLDSSPDSPAIVAVMSKEKFREGSNLEAAEIAMALRKLLSGQEIAGEEIAKIRQQMAKVDEDARKWNEDRAKFAEDMRAMGDKLRVTGETLEKLQAGAIKVAKDAVAEAKAQMPGDRKRFEEILANEPKVDVQSPGKLEVVRGQQGSQQVKIFPEVVKIKHLTWVFPPGKIVSVPKSVANVIENRRRSEQETQERQDVLSGNLEDKVLADRMRKIDEKYKSKTESMPVF